MEGAPTKKSDPAAARDEPKWAYGCISGPVNVVSPNPVTNREFTKTLGRVLKRPTLCPIPAIAARAMFGEMADDLLLAGARIRPKRLLDSAYDFVDPDLEPTLRDLLDH